MDSRLGSGLWSVLLTLFSLAFSCLVFGQAPVYVVNNVGSTISAIASNGNVTSFPVSGGSGHCDGRDGIAANPPYLIMTDAISPDGGRLYVVAHQTNSVQVFD